LRIAPYLFFGAPACAYALGAKEPPFIYFGVTALACALAMHCIATFLSDAPNHVFGAFG